MSGWEKEKWKTSQGFLPSLNTLRKRKKELNMYPCIFLRFSCKYVNIIHKIKVIFFQKKNGLLFVTH